MQITIRKLTDVDLLREAAGLTINADSGLTLGKAYQCEHSPMRTQMFWIVMEDIPTFVSVHLVRHKIGVEHFVKSNRRDRGGNDEITRMTPVNHGMLINAQALIEMARKRLCYQASLETRRVMEEIKAAMWNVDEALSTKMVSNCTYRGGYCPELKPCGRLKDCVR